MSILNHQIDVSFEKQVEWWKAVIDSINDGILVIDQEGIVQLINPEYTRITGVTSDILGKPLREYRPGAQLPDTLEDRKCRVGVYRKTRDREYLVIWPLSSSMIKLLELSRSVKV